MLDSILYTHMTRQTVPTVTLVKVTTLTLTLVKYYHGNNLAILPVLGYSLLL